MIRTNSAEKSSLNIANPIREEAKKHRTPLFSLSLMGPREGAPRMLITPPTIHQYSRFIFLWRSIDFLLFSLPLIPGSVSSVAFYRGAIIRGLITTPLAAYLLPGDSLFKPLPNDLGKLTCSTSQGCGASLMSEGVAPMQGLLVLLKKKREREREAGNSPAKASITHLCTYPRPYVTSRRWPRQTLCTGGFSEVTLSFPVVVSESIQTVKMWYLCLWSSSSVSESLHHDMRKSAVRLKDPV